MITVVIMTLGTDQVAGCDMHHMRPGKLTGRGVACGTILNRVACTGIEVTGATGADYADTGDTRGDKGNCNC